MTENNRSFLSRVVEVFLTSRLSIMLILISLALGAFSIYITPKEEEPQIVVPMADIYVQAPGASPEEIEKLVATPLEKLLWEIDGVEYVYSMSTREKAIVTVRFFVGQDRENSIVKLHNKIQMNLDRVPPIVTDWLIKPIEIDDVPIVNLFIFRRPVTVILRHLIHAAYPSAERRQDADRERLLLRALFHPMQLRRSG